MSEYIKKLEDENKLLHCENERLEKVVLKLSNDILITAKAENCEPLTESEVKSFNSIKNEFKRGMKI